MGSWGHNCEESDDYLDLLSVLLKPFKEIVETLTTDGNMKWYVTDDKVINAGSIFYDILSANNHHLFYHSNQDVVVKYINRINNILDKSDFKGWRDPDKRRAAVQGVVDNLNGLLKTGSHSTSLFNKIAEGEGISKDDIIVERL
jgi:hypothetical protein